MLVFFVKIFILNVRHVLKMLVGRSVQLVILNFILILMAIAEIVNINAQHAQLMTAVQLV
jgi:hypothetical protein